MSQRVHPRTKIHCLRISISHIGNKYALGKKYSKETRERMSESKKGNKYAVGVNVGDKSYLWKGDKVGYRALHFWVRKVCGAPSCCENCGKKKGSPKSIHWANKSRKYKRVVSDWMALCVPCHKFYDLKTKKNDNKN